MGSLPFPQSQQDLDNALDHAQWEEWFAYYPVDLQSDGPPYTGWMIPVLRCQVRGKWYYATQQERALRRLTQ